MTNLKTNCLASDKRQSNIELLRIISMFLVLLIHYIPVRGEVTLEALTNNPGETLFGLELRSICFVCVNCFIIISGYFGIQWKWKSFLAFIYQAFFWMVAASVIALAIGIQVFDAHSFLLQLSSFLSFNWFVLAYLGLYLIAPLLNSFTDHTSKKQLGVFILVFYGFSTIFGYITKTVPEFNDGCSFLSLAGLYLIGAYIRKYKHPFTSLNKYLDLALYFGIGFCLVAVSVVALKMGITKSIYGYMNPLIVIQSALLFLFFSKLRIPYNRWINYFAASTFAVYLFHYNPSIITAYLETCQYIFDNFAFSFPLILLFLISVFITAVLIDKIRIWSFDKLIKLPPFNKVIPQR